MRCAIFAAGTTDQLLANHLNCVENSLNSEVVIGVVVVGAILIEFKATLSRVVS